MNRKFAVPAAAKGTVFRRCSRTDLDWIFTVQAERVVAQDNTVAIGDRRWQTDKTRFPHTLAGCTVTIHEHLDGTVSMRYGPHVVDDYDSFPLQRKNFHEGCVVKPDRSRVNRTGHLDMLSTGHSPPLGGAPLRLWCTHSDAHRLSDPSDQPAERSDLQSDHPG
ncbi:MAG TPA: hypothetical protein VLE22_25720 [Bryobacteraceae bacterium]|nr:hypothetical protein [Bryobacteraceae bacterium]